jgi:hypothetical protein
MYQNGTGLHVRGYEISLTAPPVRRMAEVVGSAAVPVVPDRPATCRCAGRPPSAGGLAGSGDSDYDHRHDGVQRRAPEGFSRFWRIAGPVCGGISR